MSIGTLINQATRDGSLSERYRAQGNLWAKLDGHARKLEELKSAEFAKRQKALGDKPLAASERDVKATQGWHDFVTEVAQARTEANKARVEMDYLHMRWQEQHRRQ